MAKKPSECPVCGVARRIMITAKVRQQSTDGDYFEVGYKRMCVPCLLGQITKKSVVTEMLCDEAGMLYDDVGPEVSRESENK